MTAVVLGVLTALLWTNSNLCSSRSVRMIGPSSVVAWVMLVGLVLTLPFTLATGVPEGLDASALVRLIGAGAASVVGLVLLYAALRVGKAAVVAPIAATEGAITAVLAAVTGESLAPLATALLLVVVCGVTLSALAPDPAPVEQERPVVAALLASGAAVLFGVGLFLTGRLSNDLPLSWVLLPPRVVGVLALLVPLLVVRRLRMTRRALPLVVATGVSEVLGFMTFALGARDSVAVVAVLASQVATFTAIGAWLIFRERLGRAQLLGIVLVIAGVTGLAVATGT